ncbi:MAG: hypothetical protein LBV67_08060 [Streptococcaceae bacterium]|jgi:hypothetical protein|nr:hypothetical protein [Streptococcaceae bacterium]
MPIHELSFKNGEVLLDGQSIKGVQAIKLESSVGDISKLKLELLVDIKGLNETEYEE